MNIAAQLNGKFIMMSNEIFLTSTPSPDCSENPFCGLGQGQSDSGWKQKDCNGKRE
jgi:hypothetical protein